MSYYFLDPRNCASLGLLANELLIVGSWLKAMTRENRKIVLHSSAPKLPALIDRAGEGAVHDQPHAVSGS